MGTNGAPCPPSMISSRRKSDTVGMPVSAAMAAPSPIWNITFFSGSWKTVLPWEAIMSGRTPNSAMKSFTLSPRKRP